MILHINNEPFKATHNDDGILIISLTKDSHKSFFNNWYKEVTQNKNNKKMYTRDINFTKIDEYGKLINCFPITNKNEDSVQIVYDSYQPLYKL